jgi:Ca2+-binding EF-hand superfamily protein
MKTLLVIVFSLLAIAFGSTEEDRRAMYEGYFKLYDLDTNGYFDEMEVREVRKILDPTESEEDNETSAYWFTFYYDRNGDGKVTLDEYLETLHLS